MKTLLLTPLFVLVGCVGPMTYREAQLPDGSKLRVYHAGSLLSPSVTIVATMPRDSTNWMMPQVFSGPGLIPGASTGGGIAAAGALLRPSHSDASAIASGGSADSASDITVNGKVHPPHPPKGQHK